MLHIDHCATQYSGSQVTIRPGNEMEISCCRSILVSYCLRFFGSGFLAWHSARYRLTYSTYYYYSSLKLFSCEVREKRAHLNGCTMYTHKPTHAYATLYTIHNILNPPHINTMHSLHHSGRTCQCMSWEWFGMFARDIFRNPFSLRDRYRAER